MRTIIIHEGKVSGGLWDVIPGKPTITTQRDLRRAFWQAHPDADRSKIKDHSGTGRMYKADTRAAFVDFVDMLARQGVISEPLAQRVTL